jgi:DNA invertase Pin-like site-specific DNA recombinase
MEVMAAVIYAAKSTEDKHGSIGTQIEQCRERAQREGWEILGEYQDEGFSAYSGSRGPGLAAAREHAARAAAERGEPVKLLCQHSDRLSRGAGDKPKAPDALIEIWHAERRRNVHLRSVSDDADLRDSASVANMGARNHADSQRKAEATADGRRRMAERGEAPGSVPDGYLIERTMLDGEITRRVTFDAERENVYRLIWKRAIEGVSVRSIVVELHLAGHMTAPRRGQRRAFDAARIDKVLNCATYAGLIVSRGEIIGVGDWEPYVSPDDWHRLQAERKARTRDRSPVGRPATALLARLLRCSCGATMVQQHGGPRKDGSRKRTYVCVEHMHGPNCTVGPFDAPAIEALVLENLDSLLEREGVLADALRTGLDRATVRFCAEARAAASDLAECENAIELLAQRYGAAVLAGDEAKAELAECAMIGRRQALQRAQRRQQAVADALAAPAPEQDADLALSRLYEALRAGLSAAGGDARAINGVLREHFDELRLTRVDGVQIVPVLSVAALAGWEHWTHTLDGEPVEQDGGGNLLSGAQMLGLVTAADEADGLGPNDGGLREFASTPAVPVLTEGQPPAHNPRQRSSRGTAGGSPRRSRTGGLGRSLRSRS